MTPEEPHKTVRRSARNKLGPKRLSYPPHAEETDDVKKRVRNHRNTPKSRNLQYYSTKNLNNLNKTCWQKVRKIPEHTHSNFLQIDDGDEDKNTIEDQTVSINTILLLYNSYS